MQELKVGDKGKYLSIGDMFDCEIIQIKNPARAGGPDLKIKIIPGPHYRCRSVTTIKSENFISLRQ